MRFKKLMKKSVAVLAATAMMVGGIVVPSQKTQAASQNYARLLQYSLYFYDANMCGKDVSSKSLESWRGNCHTGDSISKYGKTWDLSGGFHDAGDHVKFGLPEAYAAFVLEMSYDTDRSAYANAGQTAHLQTITTHFADYLNKCALYNGSEIGCYVVQVGDGDADHGYWGSPEAQTTYRPISTSENDPSTDITSLSAAALALHYKNFGGSQYLNTAKKLFAYAKRNTKATNRSAGSFYSSSSWADDYCLAAIVLYKVTGDSSYKAEYDQYQSQKNINQGAGYWALSWDNTAPAAAYYAGQANGIKTMVDQYKSRTISGGYVCIDDWGSARYNASLQYTGLLYDKMTGSNTYLSWATGQMDYLLGANTFGKCFVTGFNDKSAKYPHHRAATGYTGGTKGTTAHAHVLHGALVGGPDTGNGYVDSTDDYKHNEVALDYNATLVASAAALYSKNMSAGGQSVDSSLKAPSSVPANTTPSNSSGNETGVKKINGSWVYVKQDKVVTNYNGVEKNEYGWWKITNGRVDFNYYGVAKNQYGTWYIAGGKVDFSKNGVLKCGGNWYYFKGGKVTPGPTIQKNQYGWWYIDQNGKVDFNYNGVAKNQYGWWKCFNGKVNFNYYGLGTNQYGTWYCAGGKVDFSVNSVVKAGGKWYNIVGGKLKTGVTVAKNQYGWWYINQKGEVDFNFQGLATNQYGTWYLKGGKVQFGFNGTYQGRRIVGGKAQ